MRVRKRPVEVEAIQYHYYEYSDNPLTFDDIPKWLQEAIDKKVLVPEYHTEDYWYLRVTTLEGDHLIGPDDWIIRGVHGELYGCKPDIFKETYEIVDHPDNDLRRGCPFCETPHYGHFHCGTCGFQGPSTVDSMRHPCNVEKKVRWDESTFNNFPELEKKQKEARSAILCAHANEVPQSCPCPPGCYCDDHTCKYKKEQR